VRDAVETAPGTGERTRAFHVTVGRILRVNHAGEYGAIRIYDAQIAVARLLNPGVAEFLTETLSHERQHLKLFLDLMPARGTRPCGAMPLWGIGGTLLGLATGLLGTNAIMACTEAVERVVHAHLEKQIEWIGARDPELTDAVASVRDQEIGHLEGARDRKTSSGAFVLSVDRFVASMTWLLIWCSTYGALSRMQDDVSS
jgi:ubiquinone biosynthesis monooxygenase Coq7